MTASFDPRVVSNPLTSRATWEQQRAVAVADPGAFHGAIARRVIHGYDAHLGGWITWDDAQQRWTGWNATTAELINVPYDVDHAPWQRAFNDDDAPLYRWFAGGLTNACFNEVDRHVLARSRADLLRNGTRQ